jgi:hypothetical protein
MSRRKAYRTGNYSGKCDRLQLESDIDAVWLRELGPHSYVSCSV